MFMIEVLFIYKTLQYSFCARVRYTLKIGKDEISVFQFVLEAFPLDPRCPLDSDMSL